MRQTMTWLGLTLSCAILGMSMLGCLMTTSPDVHVQVTNVGKQSLSEVMVYFGPRASMAGGLPAGVTKTHLFFNGPITPEARIVFRRGDGPLMEQVVGVPAPRKQEDLSSYTLMFSIDSDQGTVQAAVEAGKKR